MSTTRQTNTSHVDGYHTTSPLTVIYERSGRGGNGTRYKWARDTFRAFGMFFLFFFFFFFAKLHTYLFSVRITTMTTNSHHTPTNTNTMTNGATPSPTPHTTPAPKTTHESSQLVGGLTSCLQHHQRVVMTRWWVSTPLL